MNINDKFVFFAECFAGGLSTGLVIFFAAYCVKKVINIFNTISQGGIE